MLSSLINTPLTIMTLGAQAHSTLNSTMIDDISTMMEREDWTCHCCGTKLPGMMEVDHTKGHKVSQKDGILPICRVCHDRKHLLWSASRKRLSLIHAPDLTYEEISQLTWAMLAHEGRDGFGFDRKMMARDINARQEDAFDAIGHSNIEAIFESILTMADSIGSKAALERLQEIDKHIKIAPTLLTDEKVEISIWSEGGFKAVGPDWKENAVLPDFVGYGALKNAGDALKAKL